MQDFERQKGKRIKIRNIHVAKTADTCFFVQNLHGKINSEEMSHSINSDFSYLLIHKVNSSWWYK